MNDLHGDDRCGAGDRGAANREIPYMVQRQIGQVIIECVQGHIANQPDMEVVINAANAELRIGGGVAGALHRTAGPCLDEACAPLAPIKPGQFVFTGAYGLPNWHVIHCLGPVYGRDEPSAYGPGDVERYVGETPTMVSEQPPSLVHADRRIC